MSRKNKSAKLSVFFDGRCVVCSHEIDLYRKRDRAGRIEFVDIMDPRFDPGARGLDPVLIHEQMHAQYADGRIVQGVDSFIAIWEQLTGTFFHKLPGLARLPGVRPLLDLGYIGFTKIRPLLPRRARSAAEEEAVAHGVCADGWCDLSAVEKARQAQNLRSQNG